MPSATNGYSHVEESESSISTSTFSLFGLQTHTTYNIQSCLAGSESTRNTRRDDKLKAQHDCYCKMKQEWTTWLWLQSWRLRQFCFRFVYFGPLWSTFQKGPLLTKSEVHSGWSPHRLKSTPVEALIPAASSSSVLWTKCSARAENTDASAQFRDAPESKVVQCAAVSVHKQRTKIKIKN